MKKLVLTLFMLLSSTGNSQKISITGSINRFGLKLLNETSHEAGASRNLILPTYSVWSMMTLLSEGARNNTLRELQQALELPTDKNVLRNNYENISSLLEVRSNGAVMDSNSVMFVNSEFSVKSSFYAIATRVYKIPITNIDFKNQSLAQFVINNYLATKTKNRITDLIRADDITHNHLIAVTANYFYGTWKSTFSPYYTRKENFYNEEAQTIGTVIMMHQIGVFVRLIFEDLRFHIIELPFGTDERISMVVILPVPGENLNTFLNFLVNISFSSILQELENAEKYKREVYVQFPKFKYNSDFTLNVVLDKMGIRDIFYDKKADLLDMFRHYVDLSRYIQYTEILVDETGTTKPSITGNDVPEGRKDIVFKLNRPFLYFIVDKFTRTVLLAGKFCNPKMS